MKKYEEVINGMKMLKVKHGVASFYSDPLYLFSCE
jgi:hypothetical protein